MEDLKFCYNCCKEIIPVKIAEEEEYNIKNTSIKVIATKLRCPECKEDISDVILDDETLEKVYSKYEELTGENIRAKK